ncbi:unnamed protein product [Cylindrotheca closterium]|uniref:lipoyl(octanoyl) transferase n=1 Tax=Cylindrotheca closterium TaxID=2856 RepID=A0AAD2CU35_9STRA|nr:unnamed protein product [Cylindrotheca closterium]
MSTSSSAIFLGPQQLGSFEVLALDESIISQRNVALVDYSSDEAPYVPFETAWDWQKDILEGHIERLTNTPEDSSSSTSIQFLSPTDSINVRGADTVIMLQHEPVYTLGTGSDEKFVLGLQQQQQQETSPSSAAVPTVRMDRGGEVTYHGPGQLTVYPVLDLRGYHQDIHWYMRALEEAILLALSKVGLDRAERQEDVTGVWVDNYKVAACGVKVKRWITMHGLAVNVEASSLENFKGIVPCGLEGRKVGCINQFLDEPITVSEFAQVMKGAIEEVFEIRLQSIEDSRLSLS